MTILGGAAHLGGLTELGGAAHLGGLTELGGCAELGGCVELGGCATWELTWMGVMTKEVEDVVN